MATSDGPGDPGQPDPRRLRWLCRRGMRELDLKLEAYLDRRWEAAPEDERACFVDLLERQDPEIWAWLLGQASPEDPATQALIERLRGL